MFSANAARAGGVIWHKDLQKAARESKRVRKPMLVKFTASWCGYCRKMGSTTFRDKTVVEQINGCFVPVSVDADKHESLMKAIGVTVLPTTVIVSPELKVVRKIAGYQSAAEMSRQLMQLCPWKTAAAKTKPASRRVSIQPASVERYGFGGYCLVSMLDDRKLRKGTAPFESRFRGKTVIFSSADHKRQFDAAPLKYWPVNGGACSVTQRDTGKTQPGNPNSAVIYRGRLWFFRTPALRKKFAADTTTYAPQRTARRDPAARQ